MSTALQITGSLNNSLMETSKLGLDDILKNKYCIILLYFPFFVWQTKQAIIAFIMRICDQKTLHPGTAVHKSSLDHCTYIF
jgi:hypothetical protein